MSISIFQTSKRAWFLIPAALSGLTATTRARAEEEYQYQSESERPSHERRREDSGRTHIAVDFDVGSALDTPRTKTGGGGAIRFGHELDLLLVSLTPELGGGYHAFGGAGDTRVYSGFIGGRLGVGKIVEPSLFAHLGLAHVSGFESRTAPMIDAGLAVDLTLLPLIDLGVHAGYNAMFPRDDGSSLKFLTLGAQAALVF